MKRNFFVVVLLIISLSISVLAVGCGSSKKEQSAQAKDQVVTLKLAHTSAPDTALFRTYEKFKEIAEKKSNGQLKIEIFPSGVLGGDVPSTEAVRKGSVDIASCGSNNMAPFTEMFLWADLPFLFKNLDGVHKVYGGPIGEEYKQRVEKELKMKVLFYADPGSFREMMNSKRVIKVPADMIGLKFRSAPSPVEMDTIRAFGASPTPVAWPETYMALEQKVVDGEMQQYHWAVTAKHQEVIKFVAETGGQHALHLALMNGDRFNKLSPELQKVILESAKEAQDYNFANAEKWNAELKQIVKSAGVQFYKPTPEEQAQWQAAGEKVWDVYKEKVSRELIDRVIKAQQ